MNGASHPQRLQTVVIGAGQAGLAVGYHLQRMDLPFVILEGNARVGDTWRRRWDSLRLFTPARYDGLPGMPFPAPRNSFPSKDAMADFLEAYAARFELPVRTGVRVTRLWRDGHRFLLDTPQGRLEAAQVVVAMANYQRPSVPAFASELDPAIRQLHSAEYRNTAQLRPGPALVVGAGNSGAEIALELSRDRATWLSGNGTGEIPFDIKNATARRLLVPLVLRVVFHRVLTIGTPIGRKVRPRLVGRGGPLIRTRMRDLSAAAVMRVPRMAGVTDGRPRLDGGQTLDVANVVWCTGFRAGFEWIDLPLPDEHAITHGGGADSSVPGLYFTGLHFLYAASSAMVHGAGRDGRRVARAVARRAGAPQLRSALARMAAATYAARPTERSS
ncbi:MAG TPA: NAD(P)-binding domain-containing protein [Trueperaceae bacterium]|nr:NAD(P)-binding domain-containing protein [Trueperaceae bacterium]